MTEKKSYKAQIVATYKRKSESGKAVLIRAENGVEAWIPTSVISNFEGAAREGEQVTLTIPQWVIKNKNLK